MKKIDNRLVITWIQCLLICIILVLPARFYNGFYLQFFAVDSNLSVYYVNGVDLAIVLSTLFAILGLGDCHVDSGLFGVFTYYIAVNTVLLIAALLSGRANFAGELISKTVIVFCCCIIATQLKSFTELQQSLMYLTALCILVIASFFLSGYKGYAAMNRVGSLGFGTNETAFFACCILAVSLFVKNTNPWIRIGGVILSIACILNVASRRGMFIAIAILALWLVILLFRKKSWTITLRSFFISVIILVGLIWIGCAKFDEIVKYINDSAFMVRFRFAEKSNSNFMDISDRFQIYKSIVEFIGSNLLFGSFGCDTILAQGALSHAHNVLLQFLATHGVIFGTVINSYFLVTLYRAIRIVIKYIRYEDQPFPVILSIFFILYIVYDFFGYLLWNPKGLFWIVITMFMIQLEYHDYVKGIG